MSHYKLYIPLLVLAACGAALAGDSMPFREGELFPGVVLPSLEDGRPRSAADFRGKPLVLHVFASW